MRTFRVELGTDAHPVHVGAGALDLTGRLAREAGIAAGRVLIVTDSNVARLYGERAVAALESVGFAPRTLEVAPGEQSKSFATLERVYDAIIVGLEAPAGQGGGPFRSEEWQRSIHGVG